MNTLSKIFYALLLAATLVASFSSCSSKGKVDEATFKASTNISDDNLTVLCVYDADGFEYRETVRIVDGVAYVKLEYSEDWFEVKAQNYADAFVAISECYSDFKYKKGSYKAGEISALDALGMAVVYKNVEIVFGEDGRIASFYYEIEDGASLLRYTYTFENYGFTVAP